MKRIEQLKRVIAEHPRHVPSLTALAWEFSNMGNYYRARKYLERVRQFDNGNREALNILQSIESRWLIQKYSGYKSFFKWHNTLVRGLTGDSRVSDRLCRGTTVKTKWVREECVRALGIIGGEKAVEALVRVMDQRSMAPQVEKALMKICDKDLSTGLLRKLIINDKKFSINIIIYLGFKKSARAADALIDIARDESGDKWVRGSASWALGQIGDTAALDTLRKMMNDDKEDYVREESEEAYHRIISHLNHLPDPKNN
jgi:HEAT repeats/PBS lyase HEAT-like repeat